MTSRRLSLAIAVHNEDEVLPELVHRVALVLDDVPGGPHEVVLVDDGSTDETWERILEAVGVRRPLRRRSALAQLRASGSVDGRARDRDR